MNDYFRIPHAQEGKLKLVNDKGDFATITWDWNVAQTKRQYFMEYFPADKVEADIVIAHSSVGIWKFIFEHNLKPQR